MKYHHHFISILIILFSIVSCKKEPATEIDASFIGNWKHYTHVDQTRYLEIDDDSEGYILHYENGNFKSDTQRRKWLIKNNTLFFGWLAAGDEKFVIDHYPEQAPDTIISQYDTIFPGQTYLILDGKYYARLQ